jgi:hypothetical protein
MASIFALQGLGSSGKTSTLIELLNLITAKYPRAAVQAFHGGTRDVKVIVFPVNGLKVGIESRGDPNSRLLQSLADFRNANCDIVFCACRTSGMTVQWINAMSPPDIVQFIPQIRSQTGQQAANLAMVAHLMQLAGI